MTMPMRMPMMGYGYGGGQVTEQDYYGPANPGHELAQAVLQTRASKRADEEEQANVAERRQRTAREAEWDPISMALARARLAEMGVTHEEPGGGESRTEGQPPRQMDTQAGLPPAQPSNGGPPRGAPGPGAPMRDTAPGRGVNPFTPDAAYAPPTGTAHDLPGAYNPLTGTHNPADINLGDGYRMPYSMTGAGRRASTADLLMHSGLRNMTPAAAALLAQDP
jgi:hypothetical protein